MTWIEENEMDIFTAIVYSDQDKLLEYHRSHSGNGLPSDIIFFAVVMKNIEMIYIEFLKSMNGMIIMLFISRTSQKKRE